MNNKFFVDYYKEERDEIVLQSDKGFIVYKIYDQAPGSEHREIMFCELYVAPEHRRTGEAQRLTRMAEDIGRKAGCTHASCYIQHKKATEEERERTTHKMRIYMKYGFKFHSANESQILLYKDL